MLHSNSVPGALVTIHHNQPTTNSLLVADKFGKQHKDVVRAIKTNLNSAQNCAQFYELATYVDSINRKQQMYLMNKDGFVLLVMGFTGPQALAFKIEYITAFNAMEAELRKKRTQEDPSRYVPIEKFETLKRIAHMESELAKFWQESSQRYLDLYRKTVDNHCRMIDERLAAVQARAKAATPTWMTVAGYASLHDIPCSLSRAGGLGRKARLLCNRKGITPDTIPDPRFGRVNTYPVDILKEVFDTKIR